jgi:hypothetical protein
MGHARVPGSLCANPSLSFARANRIPLPRAEFLYKRIDTKPIIVLSAGLQVAVLVAFKKVGGNRRDGTRLASRDVVS